MKTSVLSNIGSAVYIILSLVAKLDAARLYGACAFWKSATSAPQACDSDKFPCLNGDCVSRSFFCDGEYDCVDRSDELLCNESITCPSSFSKCSKSSMCIPNVWMCDGKEDCPSGEDELSCAGEETRNSLLPGSITTSARQKAVFWMNKKSHPSSATRKWGPLAHKSAVALYLSDLSFSSEHSSTRQEMAYELSILLLSLLAQKPIRKISQSDLASFVNALLVTCLDPRDFYGFNLIQELKERVNRRNYINPYVLIALCNAGQKISQLDISKLNYTFWNSRREIWTDTQALIVLALSCAKEQPNSIVDSDMIKKLTMELKHQFKKGTLENFHTTALVMQALYAAETDEDLENFDEVQAVNRIIQSQQPDGSFGSLILTYYALPVLSCKSLVNISSSHCPIVHKDENTVMYDLVNRPVAKIRVQYSLWIGLQRDLERTLALHVPVNTTIFGIMEIASQIDTSYKFEYATRNQKPYVTALSGILDDAESGKFWFPYIQHKGIAFPLEKNIADIMLKDGDQYMMWYRKASWVD